MLIDTHAHFCDPQFDPDRPEALRRARERGVATVVEIADGPQGWEAARALAEGAQDSLPTLYWTCGFHPHHAAEQAGFDFDIMRRQASSPRCVAVGEIGLDYFKSQASKEDQISLFRKTLEVAADLDKPVVIHCRDAQADTLRILKSFFAGMARRDVCPGVIHCFSGDLHFAEGCLDLGFYLGVDGPVTYPGAKALREVLAQVPPDKLVLETDCPYLPPQGFRGQRNESSYLELIAGKLAELLGKSAEEVARATTANARRLYRLNRYEARQAGPR